MSKEGPQLESTTPTVEAPKAAPKEGQVSAPVEAPKTPEEAAKADAKVALDAAKTKADSEVTESAAEARGRLKNEVLEGLVSAEAVDELRETGDYFGHIFKLWGKDKLGSAADAEVGEDGVVDDKDGKDERSDKKTDKKNKDRKEREKHGSWPEPLPLEKMQYPGSPFSTKLGRLFHKSSGFGMRMHSVQHVIKMHEGLDLNIGSGSDDSHEPLYAEIPLVVKKVAFSSDGGNSISLMDPNHPGKVYIFRHLDELPPLKDGDTIDPGICFAKIGNSGALTTSPHLHLEVELHGKHVDPMDELGELLHLA